MRTLAIVALVVVSTSTPTAARAQDPTDAQRRAELARLLSDQLLRLQALERDLEELREEMRRVIAQQGIGPGDLTAVALQQEEQLQPFEHAVAGEPPVDQDPEGPSGDLPRARPIDAYGSLRAVTVWLADGANEIRDNASRLGARGQKQLVGPITGFARVELGFNMVANDQIIISGDPGAPIGQGSQAVFTRLGLVGLETPIGAFSWGKQWSAYYDVAEFTDQFQVFSGFASGAWAAGTDGGISGTGRAERAFLYREVRGPVSAAVQVQNRASSPNDRSWADAWGVSTVITPGFGFSLGAAYNEVRDGVEMPTPNQPQLGDQAALFGVRFRNARWYAAATYAITEQHEIDDLGRRFDGNGWELAVRREITDRVWVEGGYNDLRPDSNHPGDYKVQLGVLNVVYRYGDASRLFLGVKFDGSQRSDGGTLRENAFAGGLNFTF